MNQSGQPAYARRRAWLVAPSNTGQACIRNPAYVCLGRVVPRHAIPRGSFVEEVEMLEETKQEWHRYDRFCESFGFARVAVRSLLAYKAHLAEVAVPSPSHTYGPNVEPVGEWTTMDPA